MKQQPILGYRHETERYRDLYFPRRGLGLSFLVVLRVVGAFGWAGAVAFRCFIAAGTLFAIAKLSRRKLDFHAGWKPFAIVGATTVAGQLIGLSYGTPLIGTAMAAICVASIPLFSMVISQLWGLERITSRGLVGLLLGVTGIVCLVGFPAVAVTPAFVMGCIAVLFPASQQPSAAIMRAAACPEPDRGKRPSALLSSAAF